MPTYFQRPENALKRANEFIDVGKKQRALDALYDVIKSKKHRTWQKIHEPIMEKYLQLCVELRKSHIAKEGLYQYKNICQQVNIKSLEDVVRKYISLAESKTEAARAESHQAVVDIDDLDNPDTPESLLLKAVSGEDTQDRTDRAILTPWVKFLWESYRQCLDLLRNNSRVERLYQDIAQQAFKFCLKYNRKTEFRKLCDNLRTHLGHIHKHQHQTTAINLNNPESQGMHLETRLEQLDSAIKMELWQEAFKAVEDIHGLIQLSKKSPKPSLMANYYQKLGLVFWKSGNGLFHASTLHRLYILSREQRKNLSADELQKMASRVLCATLAVPIPASRNTIDQLLETDEATMEKKRRLATLLMLNNAPTRQSLIKDFVKFNIIQYVHPEIQNLFKYLEEEFHPLGLYDRVKASIEFISNNEELGQYIPALEEIIITRVLKQVSQVYQTIAFSRLADLIPFASKFRLERVIVDAAKTLELQVRIDHRSKSLSFGTDLMVAQKEDVPEGPYIQSMPSEGIRNQLISMARALHQAIERIEPKDRKVQRHEMQVQIANSYRMTAKKEHQRILQRRQIIEDRKEQLEHLNDQREREEQEQIEEQKKKAYDLEMARLEREAKERERLRKIEEHKEIKKKHAMERIEQLKKTDIGAKVLQNLDEELRTHLGHIHKHQHQTTAINLNNPESQGMHLETRLEQLDSAIKMELWQEAFKAVEDIHGLIQLSKKSPKPSLMANYYQKLGLVFWKSGNGLFHASTLHRLYILSREQRKNLSADELQKMASRVLCATLAVPIPASRNTIDQLLETDEATMEKKRRLATLLMLNNAPTRQSLIKDFVKFNIIQYVHPEIQNLFKYLEEEFHPLGLYDRVKASIEFISNNEELGQYIPALEEIIITRVLKQVSQVYQTIAFSRLADLIPFASKFRLERVIVDAAKTLELQVRIDHRSKSLSFGTDLMVAQKEDVPEGPYIQSMPSEGIRNQLISMARALHQAIERIEPKDRKVQRHEMQVQIANSYRMTAKKEHQRILQRRQIIEDRKEQLEHLNDQREREEQEQIEEQKKKAYDLEMARLEREAKERERLRKIEEHKEIKKKHAMERIEQLKKTDIGAKVLQNLDEEAFETLDVEDIMAKQVEQLEKEKKELMDRLKNQEKKIDHFARAKRLEEIPYLAKQYEQEKKVARDFFEQQEAEKVEQLKSDRQMALASRDRLNRMKTDKDEFLNLLRGQRKEMFKKKLAEFEAKVSEERKKRLYERKEKRREDRRQKWIQERAEEEQRRKDEQLKREREEKEREESEKLEAEKREYESRLAKLEEQAEKQRQREREIEEKEAKRRQEMEKTSGRDDGKEDRPKPFAGRPGERPSWRDREREKEEEGGRDGQAWRPAGAREGGGWREREKQRSESWKKETSPTKRYEEEEEPKGEGWRGERGAPREDRPPARGISPPRDTWRSRGEDRVPSRDGGDRGGFGERRRDDRDFGRGRDDRDRDFGRRDDRDFGRRDDRDFGRRDDRDFGRRDDRDFGRRDDKDRDFGRRDDRDFGDRRPPREDRDFGDRRAPPREDRWRSDRDQEGFSDRAPPREETDWGGWEDRWGGGGGGEERRGGDAWRDRLKEEGGDERGGGALRGGRTGERGPERKGDGAGEMTEDQLERTKYQQDGALVVLVRSPHRDEKEAGETNI